MAISNEQYKSFLADLASGKIVNYEGRSAGDVAELDFILAAADTDAKPEKPLPQGWTDEQLDTLADRFIDKLLARMDAKDKEREAEWRKELPESPAEPVDTEPVDTDPVDPTLPDSPLNSMAVANLKEIAAGYSIATAGMKKSDLIRAIEAKQAESAPPATTPESAEGATA